MCIDTFLRYIKYELENNLKKFEIIKMYEIKKIYCNDDWYVIKYKNGEIYENEIYYI